MSIRMKTAKTITIVLLVAGTSARAQTTVGSFFDFNADVRLFTAYAFMNAAGNDGEWRKAGMHPIRIAVRKDLEGTIDADLLKRMKKFSDDRGGSWTLWGPYALLTDGPPDFALKFDSSSTEYGSASMTGLSALYAEFYRKAGIERLWKKYRPGIQALNDRYKPFGRKALDDIIEYCRLNPDFFSRETKRVHFQYSPLQSYFTAWEMKVNGEMWIVAGPQEGKPGPSTFYHEALHAVITPLLERYIGNVDRSAALLRVSKEKGSIGYETWPELVGDCFTRTIDKVLEARLFHEDSTNVLENLKREYKLGFILCFSIYESLRAYEQQQESFGSYFPVILDNIDVDKERARWKKFWQGQ